MSSARLAVTAAALAGDSGGLYNLVSKVLGDGVPFDRVLFDLLIPAEKDLGTRWQQGDYLVAEEHAATATIETVISLLAGSFDQPDDAATIVIATAQGDDHSLPARAISAHLLFLGYRTIFLGANVLASDLVEFLDGEEVSALILGCAMTSQLPGARKIIKESHAAGVPVVVGGKGFGHEGEWAGAMGADAWVGSLEEVALTLESWSPDLPAAEKNAKDIDDVLESLIDSWPAIVGNARAQMGTDEIDPRNRARVLSEIGLALDAVISSMLVEDNRVLRSMLKWQRETLVNHGLVIHEQMIRALTESLRKVSADAAVMLESTVAQI